MGWRAQNSWTIRWTNPPQQLAPIAGARYSLCPAEVESTDADKAAKAKKACVADGRSKRDLAELTDLKVPKAGEWILRLWLVDAAGNANPDSAIKFRGLGYDPTPPEVGGFAEQDPNDPARVFVRAQTMTCRRSPAAPSKSGGGPRAPGDRLPTEVRARRADRLRRRRGAQARTLRPARHGHQRSRACSRGPTAAPTASTKTIKLPIRLESRLVAGRRVGTRCARRRGRADLSPEAPPDGRRDPRSPPAAAWAARRRRQADPPAAGRGLAATEPSPAPRGSASRLSRPASVATSATAPPRARRERSASAIPALRRSAATTRTVRLRVRAASTLNVNRRQVINGEYVTFSGQLKGGWRPPTGVLVELQVLSRGRWRTFAQPRADGTTRRVELPVPVRDRPRRRAIPLPRPGPPPGGLSLRDWALTGREGHRSRALT